MQKVKGTRALVCTYTPRCPLVPVSRLLRDTVQGHPVVWNPQARFQDLPHPLGKQDSIKEIIRARFEGWLRPGDSRPLYHRIAGASCPVPF